jgi:hypothetical protein
MRARKKTPGNVSRAADGYDSPIMTQFMKQLNDACQPPS